MCRQNPPQRHPWYSTITTTRRATGFSPFYLLNGTHPLLPCDLAEATFMVRDFTPGMEESDLLAARIKQLLKLPEDVAHAASVLKKSRFRSKEAFEKQFGRRLIQSEYQPGGLVLLRMSVAVFRLYLPNHPSPFFLCMGLELD